jgi:CRP/FNR family cyclic AMP-dependent transcriptional regulator
MLTVQKVLFLRRVDLFSSMSSRELGSVALIAEEVVYSAGAAIFKEGDFGDAMFLIVDGEVRIHRGGTELNRLRENGYFGEMTILDGEPRSASASAVSDCLVLRITQADFHLILSGNFQAVLSIMRTLSQRIRRAESRAAALARTQAGPG